MILKYYTLIMVLDTSEKFAYNFYLDDSFGFPNVGYAIKCFHESIEREDINIDVRKKFMGKVIVEASVVQSVN